MEGRCDIFVPGTSAVAWVDKTHINLILGEDGHARGE